MPNPRNTTPAAPLDPIAAAAFVKRAAQEEGFDLCGIARAEALDREKAFFEQWIAEGKHAGMHWLAANPARRCDPRLVLEGCRSVVVLGVNYGTERGRKGRESDLATNPLAPPATNPAEIPAAELSASPPASSPAAPGSPSGPTGRIARYARYEDYHRRLEKPLRRLSRRLCESAGHAVGARAYADAGPILEKPWAQRAGLGFIGKNTCLIHPKRGSWFLLGVILTTWELAADSPVATGCGACRRCLDICPTQAFTAPGVLDAGRCISYLTIEDRSPTLDPELANSLEGWLFGCDLCQEVCPYNQMFSMPARGDGLLGAPILEDALALGEVLRWGDDDDAFLARVTRRSPLRRTGRAGLQRTATALAARKTTDPA